MRGRQICFRLAVACVVTLLALSGCESFFTSNAFGGLQRSPADMDAAELEVFAADALASGDTETIKSTFEALKTAAGSNPTASQTSTLVELGVAATGIPELVTSVATSGGELESIEDVETLLEGFDSDTAEATAAIALEADPGTLTGQQYAYAALGLVGAIAAEEDSFENIETADGIDDAQTLLDLSIAAYEADGEEESETYQLLLELQAQIEP